MQYTAVAAGAAHTVLVRSDGQATVYGNNRNGQRDVPVLPDGVQYAVYVQ